MSTRNRKSKKVTVRIPIKMMEIGITPEDLHAIRYNPHKYYMLVNDIHLTLEV